MKQIFVPLIFLFSLSAFTYSERPAFSKATKPGDTLTHTAYSKMERSMKAFSDSMATLYDEMDLASYGLDRDVFQMAITGYQNLKGENLNSSGILTIIDFTKPGTEKRFYCLDLRERKVLFHSLVAHGRNSGGNMASEFSNKPESNQSSLGFYVTGETYVGTNGYSLRLDGVDKAWNDNLRRRSVVVHGADYVSKRWVNQYGRLGRSYGCPALPSEIAREVIDTIKGRTLIFAYYNDAKYLTSSAHLDRAAAARAFFSQRSGEPVSE